MSSVPVRLSVKLPAATEEEFVNKYGKLLSAKGMYIPTSQTYTKGTILQFEILLSSAQVLLRGKGKVIWVKSQSQANGGFFGIGLQFTQLDEKMTEVAQRLLSMAGIREPLELVTTEQPPPMPNDTKPNDSALFGAGYKETRVIGIDLGTTNSACSVVEKDTPYVISRNGANTIPSVVAIDKEGNLLIGQEAKLQMVKDPTSAVNSAKRLIGRNFHSPIVQAMRKRVLYEIFEGPLSEPWVRIANKEFSLSQISGLILGEIRSMAEKHLGEDINRAVISVPAYYNESQRSAVRQAGEIAGLKVERIVSEPTAAALAYGFRMPTNEKVMVYDLGGGTFDASLLDLSTSVYEVAGTGGDNFLGGGDFDDRIVQFCIDFIKKKHKIELTGQTTAVQRLKLACEASKCLLSELNETEIRLPYLTTYKQERFDFSMPFAREQLYHLTQDLVDKTLGVCDQVLKACHVKAEEIDNIILVGGQSRFPLVHQRIHEHLGKRPDARINPDEAVAFGAALLAYSLERFDAVVLIDVLPITLGVGDVGGIFKPLLESNTKLPASARYYAKTTHDNQAQIEVPVFQGEYQHSLENEYLGTITIANIPPGPAGSHQVTVVFEFSEIGELQVRAAVDKQELQILHMKNTDTPETLVKKQSIPEERIPPIRTSLGDDSKAGLFVRIFGNKPK